MACLRLAESFDLAAFAYAHRGLWTQDGPTENSLEAFMAAAANGLGIEFDVRPAADGVPIVFHDPVLDRMTSETGRVEARASHQLIDLPLTGGGKIVSLEALLQVWPGETPLLTELKIDGATDPSHFARRVSELLLAASGPVAAMSFSTEAVAALPKTLMRGQLIAPSNGKGTKELAATPTVTVDYLACHIRDAHDQSLQAGRHQRPLITWTVRTAGDCAILAGVTDSQIFEGFDPDLAKRTILNR